MNVERRQFQSLSSMVTTCSSTFILRFPLSTGTQICSNVHMQKPFMSKFILLSITWLFCHYMKLCISSTFTNSSILLPNLTSFHISKRHCNPRKTKKSQSSFGSQLQHWISLFDSSCCWTASLAEAKTCTTNPFSSWWWVTMQELCISILISALSLQQSHLFDWFRTARRGSLPRKFEEVSV